MLNKTMKNNFTPDINQTRQPWAIPQEQIDGASAIKTGSALKSSSAAAMDYEGNESTPARDISLHVCTGQSMASSPGTPLSLHLSLPLLISSFLSFHWMSATPQVLSLFFPPTTCKDLGLISLSPAQVRPSPFISPSLHFFFFSFHSMSQPLKFSPSIFPQILSPVIFSKYRLRWVIF